MDNYFPLILLGIGVYLLLVGYFGNLLVKGIHAETPRGKLEFETLPDGTQKPKGKTSAGKRPFPGYVISIVGGVLIFVSLYLWMNPRPLKDRVAGDETSRTPTATVTHMASLTPTPSDTATAAPSAPEGPTDTATPTPTATATSTPTPTPTPTATATFTPTPTVEISTAGCQIIWVEYQPESDLYNKNRSMVWDKIVRKQIDSSLMSAIEFYKQVLVHNPTLGTDDYFVFQKGKKYALPRCK